MISLFSLAAAVILPPLKGINTALVLRCCFTSRRPCRHDIYFVEIDTSAPWYLFIYRQKPMDHFVRQKWSCFSRFQVDGGGDASKDIILDNFFDIGGDHDMPCFRGSLDFTRRQARVRWRSIMDDFRISSWALEWLSGFYWRFTFSFHIQVHHTYSSPSHLSHMDESKRAHGLLPLS